MSEEKDYTQLLLNRFSHYGIKPCEQYPKVYNAMIALFTFVDEKISALEKERDELKAEIERLEK